MSWHFLSGTTKVVFKAQHTFLVVLKKGKWSYLQLYIPTFIVCPFHFICPIIQKLVQIQTHPNLLKRVLIARLSHWPVRKTSQHKNWKHFLPIERIIDHSQGWKIASWWHWETCGVTTTLSLCIHNFWI